MPHPLYADAVAWSVPFLALSLLALVAVLCRTAVALTGPLARLGHR